MREVAELLAKSDRIITAWCLGITQHKSAVHTIQELVNINLLRGAIGKPGAGVCPVRGHSNVQGDRTMGVWESPKEPYLNALQAVFGFDPPRHHGWAVNESIKAMHAGKAKIFVSLCGNLLSAAPDTEYTAEAMRNTRLTVHISTKLHRGHLVTGKRSLILPALRPHRDRRAKIGRAIPVHRKFDGRRRDHPGPHQARLRPAPIRARDDLPDGRPHPG